MAILLVEQYYDFAEELADRYLVMERGEVIASGPGAEMPERDQAAGRDLNRVCRRDGRAAGRAVRPFPFSAMPHHGVRLHQYRAWNDAIRYPRRRQDCIQSWHAACCWSGMSQIPRTTSSSPRGSWR